MFHISYPLFLLNLGPRYKSPEIRTTILLPGHILTPLFSTIKFPSYFKFFGPSLAPVAIVKEIITTLDEQHSKRILLPFYTQLVPYVVLLPSFLRDLVQWVSCKIGPSLQVTNLSPEAIRCRLFYGRLCESLRSTIRGNG